jgi:hypothetical protein
MTCSKCGYKSDLHFQTCPECSYNVLEGAFRDPQIASSKGLAAKSDTMATLTAGIGKRYPALQTISTIYRVLAYLSAAAGLIGVIVGVSMSSDRYGGASGGVLILLSILYGAIACVTFLALSEGIHVFIDIENNTRINNALVQKLLEGKK